MPASSLDALDQALYQRLNGNIRDHNGQDVPLFDDVPEGTKFPYVTFTSDTTRPWADHDSPKPAEVTRTISIWSRYAGYREATAIAASLDQLLDHQQDNLHPPGWRVVSIHNEFTDRQKEGDGLTRRIILRYRIRLEPA